MVRTPEGQNVNDITTSTRTDAVPDGWPPPTPVEVLRVGKKLAVAIVIAILLNALTLLGLVWAICYHGGRETDLLNGILQSLQK